MSIINRATAESIIAPFTQVGAALHWIHPRSKRPIGDGWSTAPVASLDDLMQTYKPGNNIGVRLGKPSQLLDGQFLYLLDIDIRDPEVANEAWAMVDQLFSGLDIRSFPTVISGSGGASRHVYFTSSKVFYSRKLAVSDSKFRSAEGKWRYLFEIELLATNKQAVLPGSIHPDTGKPYVWEREFDFDLLAMGVGPSIAADRLEKIVTAESETFDYEKKAPLTFREGQLEAELNEIPDERINDYHDWVAIGCAIHHQTGGSDAGYKLWVQVSKRSEKFSLNEMPAKWRSFGRNRRAAITMATIRQWVLDERKQRTIDQFDDVDNFDDAPAASTETDSFDDLLDDLLGTPSAAVDDLDSLIDSAVASTNTATDWKSLLHVTEQGVIKNTMPNIALIVMNDPRLAGVAQLNEFTHETVQRTMPRSKSSHRKNAAKPTLQLEGRIWEVKDPVNGELWSDDRDFAVRRAIEAPRTQGGYEIRVADRDLKAAIVIAANNAPFHPVREYLESLKWDGQPRVERLFIDYLGTVDNVYYRDTARLTLIAAVTRIFEPGHKFDQAIILEGLQGRKKSTFIETLARSWFAELDADWSDEKLIIEQLSGAWIVETPELQSLTKSEVGAIKAFISRKKDRARLAYARRRGDFPRQSVIFGSTNTRRFLRDPTGARRFWCLECRAPDIDINRLENNIDNIWGEAVWLYRQMRSEQPLGTLPLYLQDSEAIEYATSIQEIKRVETVDDLMQARIEEWLEKPISDTGFDDINVVREPEFRTETCLAEIFAQCLLEPNKQYDKTMQQLVSNAMGQITTWEKTSRRKVFPGVHGRQTIYRKILDPASV